MCPISSQVPREDRSSRSIRLVAAALGTAAALATVSASAQRPTRTPPTAPARPAATKPAPKAGEAPPSADEQAIRALGEAYEKAFNAGDAQALAALWTSDGEYVDEVGREFRGRQAIAAELAAILEARPGGKMESTTESIRFLNPDVAVEKGVATVTPADGGPATSAAYEAIHVRRDGQWLMSSVRDSLRAPTSNEVYLREIEWLIGDWVAESDGDTLRVHTEWTANKNFITRRYTLSTGRDVKRSGMQVIGWDPRRRAIVSWHFDADGGFGSDVWAREGRAWIIEAAGVGPDGGESISTNVLTRLDDDHCTWQSVDRRLSGESLPDTAILKFARAAREK